MTIVRCPIHGIAYDDELEACPACATEPAMDERWQAMAERPKIVPMLHLGIEEHRDRLKREPVWQKGSRHAITLIKEPSLRVVLTVPQKGNSLREHHAGGPLTFYALSGAMVWSSGRPVLDDDEADRSPSGIQVEHYSAVGRQPRPVAHFGAIRLPGGERFRHDEELSWMFQNGSDSMHQFNGIKVLSL